MYALRAPFASANLCESHLASSAGVDRTTLLLAPMDACSRSVSAARFVKLSRPMMRKIPGLSVMVETRCFRALFGATPFVCALVWDILAALRSRRSSPVHLLWSLLFLKVYGSEDVNSFFPGADEKTFRKLSWLFVKFIADIEVVRISCLLHYLVLFTTARFTN